MASIQAHRKVAPLLSGEHVSLAGTLVKAWALMQSFQPKSDNSPSDDGPGQPAQTRRPRRGSAPHDQDRSNPPPKPSESQGRRRFGGRSARECPPCVTHRLRCSTLEKILWQRVRDNLRRRPAPSLCHTACCIEIKTVRNRRPHHATRGVRLVNQAPKTDQFVKGQRSSSPSVGQSPSVERHRPPFASLNA